jgi:hypothetical protein
MPSYFNAAFATPQTFIEYDEQLANGTATTFAISATKLSPGLIINPCTTSNLKVYVNDIVVAGTSVAGTEPNYTMSGGLLAGSSTTFNRSTGVMTVVFTTAPARDSKISFSYVSNDALYRFQFLMFTGFTTSTKLFIQGDPADDWVDATNIVTQAQPLQMNFVNDLWVKSDVTGSVGCTAYIVNARQSGN